MKKTVGGLLAEGVVFLVVLGALWFGLSYVRDLQKKVAVERENLERRPSAIVELADARVEYQKHISDLAGIQSYAISRSQVSDIISAIEREASVDKLTVQIPAIEEVVQLDEQGNPIVSTTGLQKVRVRIAGYGDMESLLQFLHRVEHLPYLVSLEAWSVEKSGANSAASDSAQIIDDDLLRNEETVQATSEMQAELIIGLYQRSTSIP